MPDYPVLTAIIHDDEHLGPGDTLTLEPEDARPLLRDGSLGDIAGVEAPAKAAKRGGKGGNKPAEAQPGEALGGETA